MKVIIVLFSLVLPILVAADSPDLQSKYPFRATLFDDQGQYYALYWNFSIPEATIHFAVNVSTTGWVGFGVSPNGQMPGSDVIIGWVADDGTAYFHDRFADTRSLPPIDESQDWFLIRGEEENGFTILEFSRNWTTCDPRDLEIKDETSRVVWSFQANDPTDPLGATAMFHDHMGSTSLNLIGRLTNPPADPDDVQSFFLGVNDVTIPSDTHTTYWCTFTRLPEEITSQERYITRVSATITPNGRQYIHHVLMHLCPSFDSASEGKSINCLNISQIEKSCFMGIVIGAWAVGGEDLIYPENMAYPVGGPGKEMYVVIEMHYENPNLVEDVIDNSGLTFFYTSVPREQPVGIMVLGHAVSGTMLIPPNTANYTIAGLCPGACTNAYVPEGGIHIFGNSLHTHIAGNGLTLRHLRWNPDCGVMEELEPIDQNLKYDFNYQQITHFPKEITVLPNDTLILECFYDTSGRTGVTEGGQSTRQELCLTFALYYPRNEEKTLDFCVSFPTGQESLNPFLAKYGESSPEAIRLLNNGDLLGGFNAFNWSQPDIVQDLEDTVLQNSITSYCESKAGTGDLVFIDPTSPNGLPEVGCPYQAIDKCNPSERESCCVDDGAKPSVGQAGVVVSVIAMIMSLLVTQ